MHAILLDLSMNDKEVSAVKPTRNLFTIAAGAMCIGTMLSSGVAHADGWPLSIAGTWRVVANQTSGLLIINQVGAGVCKRIVGTIFGSPVEGSYCPGAGTVTFHRYLNAAKVANQFYQAQLSVDSAVDHMGGSFGVRTDIGSPGEYSFFGSKP